MQKTIPMVRSTGDIWQEVGKGCGCRFCWLCAKSYDDIRGNIDPGHGAGCVYAEPGAWDPHWEG